jgi:glycosyltransferase involved in cell wall biosynthesis
MRVALLSFNFGQYCIRLANGLAQHADVRLLLPREESARFRYGLDPAVDLVELDLPRLRQPLQQAQMTNGVLRRIREFDPDVIHYQAGHMWFNLVWPLYQSYPLVLTVHESRHHTGDRDSTKTPQWIMDLGYRRADRIIVHGKQLRRSVMFDLGRSAADIDIVPPVPDIVLGEQDPGGPVQNDDRSVLFFGRIWPYKGLEYLIRAQPMITDRAPDARIVIAGRGEDVSAYRSMMAQPDRFEVHNRYISDDELIGFFRRAAVVVLPHIEASISGVIAVAYTFGKPIVATSVGVLPELVLDGRTGLVVPPRDERALADAIVTVLNDRRLQHALGAGGRRRLETEFDPAFVGRETIASYERAIASRRRASWGRRRLVAGRRA